MKLKRVVAWGLALTMTFCLDVPGVNAAEDAADTPMTKEEQIAMATGDVDTPGQLPGTNRTFFDVNTTNERDWFNISGFVADGVQDRSEYYEEYVANGSKNTDNYIVVEEDGYRENTTGDYITKQEYEKLSAGDKEKYRFITAEEQFLTALNREPRVIQVNAEELEMGYLYLQRNGIAGSAISPVTDYDKGYAPQTNPIIMEEFGGTGLSDLSLYDHLTLFSTTGCVIRHAGFDLGGCNDVIIRNFRMEGMYEWDDHKVLANAPYEDFNTRKRYGWCNVSLNNSNNIWIDHCTFGFAFDGNLDIKNGSSVSVTWCQFGVQDISTADEEKLPTLPKWNESKGSELWKSILYMEECYQEYKAGTAKERFEYYVARREEGATPKELLRYAAMHSKVHLCGSGESSFYTNVDEKITLGFNYYTNIIQRIPMIRQGNGHMFNCIVDNTEFTANSKTLEDRGVHVGYTYANSVNNPRDGATVGSDTCIFRDVNPSCGTERQGQDVGNIIGAEWQAIFSPMINHSLIVNSQIIKTTAASGKEVDETGSSWENNGVNAFTEGWKWDNKSSIGDFKWSKWKNQDVLAEFSNISNKLEGVTGLLMKYTENDRNAYYNDFYEGSNQLGYDYQCFELDKVEEMLETHGGAHKDIYGETWTALDYIQPYNKAVMEKTHKKKVTINLNGATTNEKLNNTYYLKEGESATLPTAEELEYDEGYNFAGWKKGSYNKDGKLELGEFLAKPDEAVVINAGDGAYEEEYYYAIWEIKTYKVTFNSMGGSEVKDVLTIEHYQMISGAGGFPADPTKDGYVFAGWYRYDPETGKYGTRVRINSVLNASMCLYAKWNNKVTFVTNGGSEIEPVGVETGKKVSGITDPTKPGFTFTGWFKDEGCTEPFDMKTDTITEPTTLYAGWESGALLGDVNDDKVIDSKDALEILKYDVGLTEEITAEAADVNGDDAIDSKDALEILKYDVGLIEEFNAGQN